MTTCYIKLYFSGFELSSLSTLLAYIIVVYEQFFGVCTVERRSRRTYAILALRGSFFVVIVSKFRRCRAIFSIMVLDAEQSEECVGFTMTFINLRLG